MQPCYLICGVSGCGKTWVCKQLKDKFTYIPHDEHYNDFVPVIVRACLSSEKPVITECPFAERITKSSLEIHGVEVIPYFVIEPTQKIMKRYYEREGKMPPQAAVTRASTIINRAIEWQAEFGTSDEVLEKLRNV